MPACLDGLVNQDIRDDGQHFLLIPNKGELYEIRPAKVSLQEGIYFKAQTIRCLFFFFRKVRIGHKCSLLSVPNFLTPLLVITEVVIVFLFFF